MKHYIRNPRVQGQASRQAHADLPPGTYEREMGKEGFFGPATFFYHRHPPTAWSDFEGPLRPHAFDLTKLPPGDASPWAAMALLHNAHMKMRYWRLSAAMRQLARNADGDELLFVHAGSGELFCDFGHLRYEPGDYIVVPRGTMWRLAPAAATDVLLIEATNASYQLPDRGLLGPHALFDEALLDVPEIDAAFRAQQDEREWQVLIKCRGQVSVATVFFTSI